MYNFISLLSHGLISFLVTFITLLSLTSFLARDIVFDNSCLFCALNILLCVVLPLLVSLPMLLLLLLLRSILILPVATTPLLLMIMLSLFIPLFLLKTMPSLDVPLVTSWFRFLQKLMMNLISKTMRNI